MKAPEIGLAFLEGLALIASPCILPVLPLILSSSIDGGRKRPYGIITGFVIAFSLFVLGSRALVNALHIDLDLIKYGSLILLLLFGLVLLSETLSEMFSSLTQGAAELGSRVGTQAQGGFLSGVSIGALIGLVWTPCAGPILATVLVQVIRQQTDLQGVCVTLAFAIGASVPMLIITLMGRTIMSRLKFFTTNGAVVRKIFGVVIIIAVVFMAFGSGIPARLKGLVHHDVAEEMPVLQQEVKGAVPISYPAPELKGITHWFNSDPLTLAELKGKVVLIDFWTYSCVNCVRTLPYLKAWDEAYRDKGLVIIGVHSPEFEFEKKTDNIQAAITQYGIQYPVAVDNDLATWTAFDNSFWPGHYLIDKEGQVVYHHFGEGGYATTENNIRYLLGLTKTTDAHAPETGIAADQTPEIYLGYNRVVPGSGRPVYKHDAVMNYPNSQFMPEETWMLAGPWKMEAQKITSQENGGLLRLHFKARKVFIVMGTSFGAQAKIGLRLNGSAPGSDAGADADKGSNGSTVTIDGHRLYELIDQHTAKKGFLEILI
nr:cytochrome c biogenesis protein DipZ [Pseudomonadota bacterium]